MNLINESPLVEVQHTRLAVLSEHLSCQVEREHFSMNTWGIGTVCHVVCYPGVPLACRTTACAGGWACSIPTFQKEGLTMQVDGPSYRGYSGHSALRVFFGLSREQETFLFDSYHVADGEPVMLRLTPKQWAKRCDKFLKSL